MHEHDFIYLICGTNRPNSTTQRVTRRVEQHYHEAKIRCEFLGLDSLPLEIYSPAAYALKPAAFEPFQQKVLDAAGLHIVLPEYNGSFPGALKYFIDMLRSPGSFEHKPVALVGLASGLWGGLRAVEQLQMIFGYRNAHIFPDRVFIPGVSQKFLKDGTIADPAIDQRLQKQAAEFARYCGLLRSAASH
jgi:chromate reductase